MMKKNTKILITGGHMTPALAVAEELIKRGYANLIWVGHKHNQAGNKNLSAEYTLVTSHKIRFVDLKAGKLTRKWTLQTLLPGLVNFLYLIIGFIKALWLIITIRPAIIISFGGYLAVPVAFWGWVFRKKIVTHEQTIVTGLANKIIAKFSKKIFVSWSDSKNFFPQSKTIMTGNPIRKEIFYVRSDTLTSNFDKNLPVLYITGGNQGANELNRRVFRILDKLLNSFNVIHQTGNSSVTRDYEHALEFSKYLDREKSNRYTVRSFIDDVEIGEAFNSANVVLSRAGANSTAEILALGKLCVLIPIPWVAFNEQMLNAKLVESTGLGYIFEQNERNNHDALYDILLKSLNLLHQKKGWDGKDIEECMSQSKKLIKLDAQKVIVDILEKEFHV